LLRAASKKSSRGRFDGIILIWSIAEFADRTFLGWAEDQASREGDGVSARKQLATSATRPGLLVRLAIPVVAVVLAFSALEAGFRVTEFVASGQQRESWAVYDPDLGYRPKPAFGDTNADGFRDHPVTPKAGRFRLLMIGDSLGYYGDDVDDTYVGRLRRELQRSSGASSIDVVNASVRGYTNYQELVLLKKYGLKFEPDLVGVGFVLNDLHKILHQFKIENGRIVGETYDFTPEAVGTVDSWAFQTARRSRALVWLRRRLDGAFATIRYRTEKGFAFDYRPDVNTAWKDASWPAIESQMREMLALGQQKGFHVFVVGFPIGDQYRAEYLERDRDYVLKPQRLLRSLCTRLGIPYLDLYQALDHSSFEQDQIHLTKLGRERAASALASFLRSNRLLPVNPVVGEPRSLFGHPSQ
jgi:lysophospholipase L1-like esterase